MKMIIYEYKIKIDERRHKAIQNMKKISAMIRLYMHIHLEVDIMLEYYALYYYIYSSTIL